MPLSHTGCPYPGSNSDRQTPGNPPRGFDSATSLVLMFTSAPWDGGKKPRRSNRYPRQHSAGARALVNGMRSSRVTAERAALQGPGPASRPGQARPAAAGKSCLFCDVRMWIGPLKPYQKRQEECQQRREKVRQQLRVNISASASSAQGCPGSGLPRCGALRVLACLLFLM